MVVGDLQSNPGIKRSRIESPGCWMFINLHLTPPDYIDSEIKETWRSATYMANLDRFILMRFDIKN